MKNRPPTKTDFDEAIDLTRDAFSGRLRRITAAAAGYIIFCYVMGWLNRGSYFMGFAAEWLIKEIAPIEFLTAGGMGLFIFFGTMALVISVNITRRWEKDMHGLVILILTFLVLAWVFVDVFFSYWISPPKLFNLSLFMVFCFTLLLGQVMINTIALLGAGGRVTDNRWLRTLVYVSACAGLFVVPVALGKSQAMVDRDPYYSKLPVVVLQDSAMNSPPLRLLLAVEGHIYVVALIPQKPPSEVRVVPWDKVLSIQRPLR